MYNLSVKFILSLIIIISLLEISLTVYLTYWRHYFWDAVSLKDLPSFIYYLIIFSAVALSDCVLSAYSGYARTILSIKWRKILNKRFFFSFSYNKIDNLNQRIQEDCKEYPLLFINLTVGVSKAIVYTVIFSAILILEFNYLFLIALFSYAIISTFIAKKIANPLIKLNYDSQSAEATYRNELNKMNFKECIFIMLGLARKSKHLQYFQSFYGQLSVIIPLLTIAPYYFVTKMTLGGLMQANSVMINILDQCSYGINSFETINRLLSCKKRLKECKII